jgi:tRNA A-37 threonylcarbamoyl transferase component Bud32
VHEPCWFRCVEGFDPATASRLAADPEGLLWEHLHEPIKLSHTSVMVRALIPGRGPDGGPLCVAYKQFRPKNVLKAALALLRTSPAVRAWRRGHALLREGIPTARPVAACVPRRRWRRPGYLATEWIEGAENLHLWGWRIGGDGPTRRLRRAARCAESLGRLVGRLHGRGYSHRDLKAANLLVREEQGRPQTWLVDLEGLRHRRRLSFRRRVADLARLAASVEAHPWVTPAVMLRFLRSYLDEAAASRSILPPPWKGLWRAVARQAAERNRRKRRRRQAVL